ncbi:MAG: VWA domain-containing protein [Bacteroidales bacterium]|jgi:Ca-activated chloride channel family protein|nr:VWA domain-containing protein [Bacteroidales bacterium]
MVKLFKYSRSIVILISLIVLPFIVQAQEAETGYVPHSRILFIFDASYSMSGTWGGDVKINVARQVLIEMVDSLEQLENVEMALRVYGHQSPVPPQDCSDTKLEVPFAPNNASRIRQKLRFLSPKGTTPIAHSLELAAGDFPPCAQCRNIIILITDGVEACDGDPCAVSAELQKKGITLRPFVIGIGNDPGFEETFGCLGHYYDAPNKERFKEVMKVVITQALNTTSAQVNLIDTDGMPTETDIAILFYDQYSGKVRYNMIHTLNSKGNPDTLALDQLSTYDVVAQTIPSTHTDSVRLISGKHNHIGIDAPQGFLLIRSSGGNVYQNEKVLVKKANQHKTINVQFMGSSERYIVGKYDLEIPIFPLIYLEDIEIRQSYTTTVEIPEPGMVHISCRRTGYGALFQMTPEGNPEWVLNLRSDVSQQDYYLQPGSYRIVFRQAYRKATMFTKIHDFEIKSGLAEMVDFN